MTRRLFLALKFRAAAHNDRLKAQREDKEAAERAQLKKEGRQLMDEPVLEGEVKTKAKAQVWRDRMTDFARSLARLSELAECTNYLVLDNAKVHRRYHICSDPNSCSG